MYKPLRPRPQERHHHPPFSIEAQLRLLRSLSLSFQRKQDEMLVNKERLSGEKRGNIFIFISQILSKKLFTPTRHLCGSANKGGQEQIACVKLNLFRPLFNKTLAPCSQRMQIAF
jgi:hypothetical protein